MSDREAEPGEISDILLEDLGEERAEQAKGVFHVLTNSSTRILLIKEVYRVNQSDEHVTQKELAERLPVNKTQVSSLLMELRDYSLVERDENSLTAVGEELVGKFLPLIYRSQPVGKVHPFGECVDEYGKVDLRTQFEHWDSMKGPVTTGRHIWEGHKYKELIRSGSEVYELVPTLTGEGSEFKEQFKQGMEGHFVIERRVIEDELKGSDLLETMEELDNVHVHEYVEEDNDPLPDFTLSIFDETVSFLGTGESKTAYMWCEDEQLVTWAKKQFRRYRENRTRTLTTDDIDN